MKPLSCVILIAGTHPSISNLPKTFALGEHKSPLFIIVSYSSLTVAVVNKVKNTIVKYFNILTPIDYYTAKDSPQPQLAVALGFDIFRKLPPNSDT